MENKNVQHPVVKI